MNKHTAKKVCAGEYEYRGFSISRIENDWGGGQNIDWFINRLDGARSWFDPADSLRQAKIDIDDAIAAGDA